MIPRSLNLVEWFWIYAHFLKYSHFQILLDFYDRWAKNCVRKSLPKVFLGSPLIRGDKRNTDQWASTKDHMEGFSLHNSSLIGNNNQANLENDCISRNGHRIKITQPNLMILVSFFFAEDALSNSEEKKIVTLLARKVLKVVRCISLSFKLNGMELWRMRTNKALFLFLLALIHDSVYMSLLY